jgi:O-antigen/teichoic acid export membrane protein
MNALPSLRANFSWTLAGNLVYSLCQWGMLSVLAKRGTPATVGQFALALAISAPIFMFSNLQLRAVQATDARQAYRFADYFTLRVLTTIAGMVIIGSLVHTLRYDNNVRWVVVFVAAAKAVECVSDVIGGLLQRAERLDQVAISLMIRGPLSIVAFGLTFIWTQSLVAATGGMVLAWVAVLLGYDLPCAIRVLQPGEAFFDLNLAISRKLLMLSLPLGIVMTLISLNVNIPRYLLEHYRGSRELGIFASLAYLVVAVSMVVNALGQAATVRLSCMFAARDIDGFLTLLLKLVGLGCATILVGLPLASLFGRATLTLLYRPEYGESSGLFLLMVATAGVSAVASFLGYGMTAARCFRSQVPVIGACTLTAALVSAMLVPRYGAIGAAWGLLASAFVLCVGSAVVLRLAIVSCKRSNAC